MKVQFFFIIALIFLASTLAISHIPQARATTSQSVSTSQTVVISGTKVFLSYSFDICSAIFLGPCPISFSVSENYTQPITVQFQDSTFLLPHTLETTEITVTSGPPNLVLILKFSVGSNSYSYPVPLPAIRAPGVFTKDISLSQILVNLASIDTGLPLSILNRIASFDFIISFVASIEGVMSLSGFNSTQGPLYWNSPIMESYNSTLTGSQPDSSIVMGNLQSEFSVDAQLSLSVPLLPPIQLIPPVHYGLIAFGSASTIPVGHWYQVQVSSPYSQPSGSGWYLSGSSVTFSVQDQAVTVSGTTYNLVGWTGAGIGSYTGSETSPSVTMSAPIQETANWQAAPAQGSPFLPMSAPVLLGLGVVIAAGLGLLGLFLFKRRGK